MIIVVGDTPSSVEINAGDFKRIGDPPKMAAALIRQLQWAASVYEASTYILMSMFQRVCTERRKRQDGILTDGSC